MLYLTEADVRHLLPMKECVRLTRTVFERLKAGTALNQPRRRLIMPTRSVLHYMAGSDGQYFGAKVYATNAKTGAHFSFLLYRAEDAQPLALLEANYLGQIRTGAATGYASQVLARPDSRTVAVIGSGFQARTQLEAVVTALPIERARVWSRTPEKRDAFAAECTSAFGLPVTATATAEAAVRDADIVITATNSGKPVLEASWIASGTHINAIGSNQANRRELPGDLVQRCGLIVVDSREQARLESGDLLLALRDEDWSRVAELHELEPDARTSPEELTLFKSAGLAVEDVIAAGYVYEQAVATGAGRPVYS
jgi:alanine dehydrogenase